jgi:hypothetical protein
MRTQSEIKKNNIRKANLLRESESRKERGQMTSKFGLYEQCGTGLDTQGEYMGAPMGTEPMDMMGDDMMDMDMDMDMDMMLGDDDVAMDDEMLMIFMEDKNAKPDFLDLDGDGNTTEPMKKAAKDKMDEKSGCGSKRTYNEEEGLDENLTDCECGALCPNQTHCHYGCCEGKCCDADQRPDGVGKTHAGSDYEGIDHKDRSEFDGRKSRVVGVDSNIRKQRMMKESYKAVSATPQKDGWGNNFNNILTENTQVNEVNSLMKRMKKVIR